MHRVPKRYHGAGSQSGTPVSEPSIDRKLLSRESDSVAERRKSAALHGKEHPSTWRSLLAHRGREEKDCWRRTQHKRSSLCDTILDGMTAEGRNLLGLAEVAELLGTTRRNAIRLTGLPDFPEPIVRLRATRVWKRADVARWAKRRKPDGRRKR
jgi:predicted DNA-binding transcriptional regulator AlpA